MRYLRLYAARPPPPLPHSHRCTYPHSAVNPPRLLLRPRLRLPHPQLVRSRPPVRPRQPPPPMGHHRRLRRRRAPLRLLPTHLLDPRSHPRSANALDLGTHRLHLDRPHRRRLRPPPPRPPLRHPQRRPPRRSLLHRQPLHALHRLRAHRLRRTPRRHLDPTPPPRHPPRPRNHPPRSRPRSPPLVNQRPRRRHELLRPRPPNHPPPHHHPPEPSHQKPTENQVPQILSLRCGHRTKARLPPPIPKPAQN